MGKSLNGKELGKGISQRKDGLYQGRFVNRFGKKQTLYAKTLKDIRQKLRNAQYEDEKALNVVTKEITLDEWYKVWMATCKKNCRESTKATYAGQYKRVQKALGWRKLTSLNLIIIQQAINELGTDNQRKETKKILVDMLSKAVDADLLIKNSARMVNTVISKEEKKERRVLTIRETSIFLEYTKDTFYYDLYILALETGMRIGELMGLKWSEIDYDKSVLYVRCSLCYFRRDGKYVFEWHDTKTHNSKRVIPLTKQAVKALKRQWIRRQSILLKNASEVQEEYRDLVFVTKNNRPTQQFIVAECIDVAIRRIRKDYPEFEGFSPHCFRHTFATRAIERGMQPKILQKLLGHGSLQTTMDLYCHVTEDTLYDAMSLMDTAV